MSFSSLMSRETAEHNDSCRIENVIHLFKLFREAGFSKRFPQQHCSYLTRSASRGTSVLPNCPLRRSYSVRRRVNDAGVVLDRNRQVFERYSDKSLYSGRSMH